MRTLIEERTGLELKEATKYEVGKTYYIGYWNTTCKVLEINEEYKCLWADGRITTHMTPLDPDKDYEVIKDSN